MRRFLVKRCCSRRRAGGKWALFAAAACLAPSQVGLAQSMSATLDQATPVLFAKAWAVTYALVFLAVALGLLVVCRPAPRQKTVRKKKAGRR